MDTITNSIEKHSKCIDEFINNNNIKEIADKLIEILNKKNKILLCGNGGSAADCSHFAAELVGRYKTERKGLSAIALTVDPAIISAWSNDYDFDTVFSRQVEALAKQGDVIIGFSTSGTSKNVINAFNEGKKIGTTNILFTGNGDNILRQIADLVLIAPSIDTPRIQECHILAYHIICELIDEAFK